MNKKQTNWTYKKDFIAFLLAKRNCEKQEITLQAKQLNISANALALRISNYKSLLGQSGLSNASKQSFEIFTKYKHFSLKDLYSELSQL